MATCPVCGNEEWTAIVTLRGPAFGDAGPSKYRQSLQEHHHQKWQCLTKDCLTTVTWEDEAEVYAGPKVKGSDQETSAAALTLTPRWTPAPYVPPETDKVS